MYALPMSSTCLLVGEIVRPAVLAAIASSAAASSYWKIELTRLRKRSVLTNWGSAVDQEEQAYLGHRVGSHETENVRLDALVEEHHVLELAGLQRVADTGDELTALHSSGRVIKDLVHVVDELSAELVVDVQLTRRCGSEVGYCQVMQDHKAHCCR